MNARSVLLVAAAVAACGGLTYWLATTQAQADVRQVGDVLAKPAEHRQGSFTLVGVPQPEKVPVAGPSGTSLAANPAWANATRTTTSWLLEGQPVFSVHTVSVRAVDGGLEWAFRNETRRTPADRDVLRPPVERTWRMGAEAQAFPVEDFRQGPAGAARVWAFYGKATENAMQPKPSQFTGRLLATLPGGEPVPDGLLVWVVDDYLAGCSSKFLPPEAQAKYNVTA